MLHRARRLTSTERQERIPFLDRFVNSYGDKERPLVQYVILYEQLAPKQALSMKAQKILKDWQKEVREFTGYSKAEALIGDWIYTTVKDR